MAFLRPNPSRGRSLTSWVRSPTVQRAAIGVAVVIALSLITALPNLSAPLDLVEGKVSPRDVESPRTVEFVDWERTIALRQQAAAKVQPVYRRSQRQTAQARGILAQTFEAIKRVRAEDPAPTHEERVSRLREAVPLPLPMAAVEAAYLLPPEKIQVAEMLASTVVGQVMAEGIKEEEVGQAHSRVKAAIAASGQPQRILDLATAVATGSLLPNLFVDEEATQRQRQLAMDAVVPVTVRVLQGEVIVRRGEVVTWDHVKKLEAVGLAQAPRGPGIIAGMSLLSTLLVAMAAIYLVRYQPKLWAENRLLLLLSLIVVFTLLATRLLVGGLNPFLVPTAAATMLLAILLHPGLALFVAPLLAFWVGIIAKWDFPLGFVTLVGTVVGVYTIRHLHRRIDLAYAGLKVGFANMVAILAVGLMDRAALYPEVLRNTAFGLANGFLAGLITIGLLPYLESLFGLLTPIKLLELSNPSHPLLRRLQMEAPGTYHHSIMMGNLAEAAAEAIGANGLLVRVGTYYHDIGKLRRPAFFVENQAGGDNPHNRMSPSLSALTISSHVHDGLQYAREHRLPPQITAFISEHHGTSLISYFYHRAVNKEEGEVEEGGYRYEGPKPQSKETAIVMLADAVEAAVRSLQRPTPDRIEQVVRRICKEKLDDGQLDESDLTLKELEQIIQVFVRVLTGMYHPRIEYPEEREVGTSVQKKQ